MPYAKGEDKGWTALQTRVAEALAPFGAELGARECIHGDWAECDAGENEEGCLFDDTKPKAGSMAVLTEFVLVSIVADMNGTEHDTAVVASPGQRNHTTKGLLHVGLYE